MSLVHKKQHIVQALPCQSPEVGRWLWALEDARRRTHIALEGLPADTPDIVDWTFPGEGNSIGTILYHLAAIEASWLYDEVLQQDFPPEVQALFPHDVRDDQGKLSSVKGINLDEYLDRLDKIRARVLTTFREMSLEEFRRPRSFPEYDVTPEWVLHHLMQHEAEHRGQIADLRMAAQGEAIRRLPVKVQVALKPTQTKVRHK